MKRIAVIFVWLIAFVVAIAEPIHSPVLAKELAARQYLPAGSVDIDALVPPPPAVGSPAFKEQMTVVLWLQRSRTPEQIAFVQEGLDVERFAPLLDDALMEVDGIELKLVIDSAIDEVRADYDALKDKYDLPRPFVVNDDVRPVTDPRPVASYPSGHAIRAIVYARLLSEIFPDQRQALMDLARQIGYGRVTAGVHYPIDVIFGQKLGDAFADVIVQQPAFKQAIKRIRGESAPTRVGARSN
jgi:acid phosphatase (class A)